MLKKKWMIRAVARCKEGCRSRPARKNTRGAFVLTFTEFFV